MIAEILRRVVWGGLTGLLVVLVSCSPPREAEKPEPEKTQAPAASAGVLHLRTESDFKSRVLDAKGVCLVDLYSMRCPPCRELAPVISSLAEKYAGRVAVCKIDIDEVRSVAQRYGLEFIPTVLFIRDGKEVDRYVGLRREDEYAARLDEILSSG
jgi:thioredoxin 1